MNTVLRNIVLALVMALVQCGSKDNGQKGMTIMPPEFNDPYFNSFRNKNIRYVISERIGAEYLIDTIELDRRGNFVNTTGPYERKKMVYDTSGFLVRLRVSSDATSQYMARYSILGDTLVQWLREFNSADWSLRGDTTTFLREVNHFVYDQSGRIIQEFDDGFGPIEYVYSKDRLVYKEIEVRKSSEDEFHVVRVAEYAYDDDGKLKEIKLLDWQMKESMFYFSTGLLDSCRITSLKDGCSSWQHRYRYRYVYY